MDDYSSSHTGDGRGRIYDDRYARGHTGAMWTIVEKPLLEKIFDEHGGGKITCLDFACGTGRITELLAPRFGSVVGVDISADMLEEAREKVIDTEFVQGNLIADPGLVGTFDVVASFRFFPNAEPDLRRTAFTALCTHLKPGGLMIVNNHQNEASLLGKLRRLRPGKVRPFLDPEEIPSLMADNGLELVKRIGFGFIPVWREWGLLPAATRANFERRRITEGDGANKALNIIYIARKMTQE